MRQLLREAIMSKRQVRSHSVETHWKIIGKTAQNCVVCKATIRYLHFLFFFFLSLRNCSVLVNFPPYFITQLSFQKQTSLHNFSNGCLFSSVYFTLRWQCSLLKLPGAITVSSQFMAASVCTRSYF